MSTPAQRARQQHLIEYIIVLSGTEAESVIAALETIQEQQKERAPPTVKKDWRNVISKIKREQRGGE